MKRIKFLPLWAAVMFFAISTVQANVSGGDVLKYEIIPVDDLHLDNRFEKVWNIRYASEKTPVTVVKFKTSDGYDYAVHSEFFEVCYSMTSKGFGVKKLRRSLCKVPPEINNAVVNPAEMERQRIISQEKVNDDLALGLIASYLPSLLNPAYAHLLN